MTEYMISNTELIIENLVGTCNSLDQALYTYDLTEDDISLEYLCGEIFRCEICSWWCPINEMSEDSEYICDECSE